MPENYDFRPVLLDCITYLVGKFALKVSELKKKNQSFLNKPKIWSSLATSKSLRLDKQLIV